MLDCNKYVYRSVHVVQKTLNQFCQEILHRVKKATVLMSEPQLFGQKLRVINFALRLWNLPAE